MPAKIKKGTGNLLLKFVNEGQRVLRKSLQGKGIQEVVIRRGWVFGFAQGGMYDVLCVMFYVGNVGTMNDD